MTVTSAMIDAMIAAGASAEVVAAAWKASIAHQEKSAENRREKTRERVRAHRARNSGNALHSVTSVTNTPPLSPPLSPAPLSPPLNTPPNFGGDAAPRRRIKPLAELSLEDWLSANGLTDIPQAWGDWAFEEHGATVSEINRTWAIFRDHWRTKGGAAGRKADWLAAWRNWWRREFRNERRT